MKYLLLQRLRAVWDDEGSTYDLCPHVEDLGDHSFAISGQTEDAFQSGNEVKLTASVSSVPMLRM